MTNMPEANNAANRILAESMVEGSSKSFATECQRICSLDEQISGVKGDAKNSKRETSAKIKMRHYHVQDPKKVKFTKVKMGLVILPAAALLQNSETDKLPNTCNKATAVRLGARRLCFDDHDQILEEINRRDRLNYDEASSEDDDDSASSRSDDQSQHDDDSD
jgi:hypothetical protein